MNNYCYDCRIEFWANVMSPACPKCGKSNVGLKSERELRGLENVIGLDDNYEEKKN